MRSRLLRAPSPHYSWLSFGNFFLWCVILSSCSDQITTPSENVTIVAFPCIEALEEGAFIFRKSSGLVSRWLIRGLNEDIPLSHCGLLVPTSALSKKGIASDVPGDVTEDWSIIHSVSSRVSNKNGMQVCSLSAFLHHCEDGTAFVSRPHQLDPKRKDALTQQALSLLENRIPFDHHFNPNDNSAIYCSELALILYETPPAMANLLRKKDPPYEGSVGFSWAFDSAQFATVQCTFILDHQLPNP